MEYGESIHSEAEAAFVYTDRQCNQKTDGSILADSTAFEDCSTLDRECVSERSLPRLPTRPNHSVSMPFDRGPELPLVDELAEDALSESSFDRKSFHTSSCDTHKDVCQYEYDDVWRVMTSR